MYIHLEEWNWNNYIYIYMFIEITVYISILEGHVIHVKT